jgi:serine acetyltransferase
VDDRDDDRADGRRDGCAAGDGTAEMSILRLLWADYRAHYDEPAWRSLLLLCARLPVDPSLHAVVLVRLVQAAPAPLRGLSQRLLLAGQAMYVDADTAIGGGLVLKHPVAIALGPGVRVGADAQLFQDVTLAARDGAGGPAPRLGAGVRVFHAVTVSGGVRVGDDALLGAGVIVEHDVAAGARVMRDDAVGERETAAATGSPQADRPASWPPDLRTLLRADYAARFGLAAPQDPATVARAMARDRGFRVVAMVRLMQAGPPPLWRLWRRALITHGCDIGVDVQAGPGWVLPRPVGVVVGRRSRIGAGVTLHEHVCVAETKTRWQAEPAGPGLRIGAAATLLPAAGAYGDVAVAPGTIVPARACVVGAYGGTVCAHEPAGAVAGSHRVPQQRESVPDAGLRALLASDLARLVPPGAAPAARRRAALRLPFQAVALVRLATRPRSPTVRRLARGALRGMHHIYLGDGVRIGPGLALPLPVGLRIDSGTAIGAGVTLLARVSLGADPAGRAPLVADGALVGAGVVARGDVGLAGEVAPGAVFTGPTHGGHRTASTTSRPGNSATLTATETAGGI